MREDGPEHRPSRSDRSGELDGGLLPLVIGQLRQNHARVRVKVLIKGSASVPAAVVNGDVDVGIAFSIPPIPNCGSSLWQGSVSEHS